MKVKEEDRQKMRNLSGRVESDDPLVSFLYVLMRDYLTPGEIEGIMEGQITPSLGATIFTNGWLAQYAKHVACRLNSKQYCRKPKSPSTRGSR